uniref:NVL2 nucleolin binding domain-containing protein n=1 Tax=Phlebotomus papatasi TaxID=29031 RepID=A0A1B0D955_PHLPP
MIKKDKPLLYDAQIISRVKQYLEDNVHQTYVDVAVMAQDLQDKYKEYNKRKAGPSGFSLNRLIRQSCTAMAWTAIPAVTRMET